jgi:hypothetical protein
LRASFPNFYRAFAFAFFFCACHRAPPFGADGTLASTLTSSPLSASDELEDEEEEGDEGEAAPVVDDDDESSRRRALDLMGASTASLVRTKSHAGSRKSTVCRMVGLRISLIYAYVSMPRI